MTAAALAAPTAPSGLSSAEAAARLRDVGPNALPAPPRASLAARVLRQFRSPIIYILLFALAFELALWARASFGGVPLEVVSIGALLVVNAVLGVVQDYRADAALDRLKTLATPQAWVVRDGETNRVPSESLVPGDIIRLEAGDRVHADARLLDERASLTLDESILTGESLPVERGASEELAGGTLVTRGKALATVVRTGQRSALGRIARMLAEIDIGETPLEKRVKKLGDQVARVVIGLCLALLVLGLVVEGTAHFADVVIFAVALAVAVVPEELPAVLALTLALGVERMAKRHAVVRRLSAVEALGSVTVIVTDKTGTLTENRMRVDRLDAADEAEALACLVLANDAEGAVGDTLETALLDHARAQGIDITRLRAEHPRVDERPFDSQWKFMRVTVQPGMSYVKGAPEVVLARCDMAPDERARWLARAEEHAARGSRVLALASAPGTAPREDGLRFLGIVALWDPPRANVADVVRKAREGGVRIVMATGDHAATARAVGRAVGIAASDVHARVAPEDKLRLVEALQARGEVVAVLGDGVNDAPALKKADIGVAMGMRGSDVAREAASLVLLDDDLGTVLHAIEEGRRLHESIQTFLRFMFTIHVAFFTLLVGGAIGAWALGMRDPLTGTLVLPLTALQILWINFLADGPPSFALGLDRHPDIMRTSPRPASGPLLDRASWLVVFGGAVVKTGGAVVLLSALPAAGFGILETQTAIFAYEYGAQLFFAYPVRRLHARPKRNVALHLANAGGAALLIVALAWPLARKLLDLAAPTTTLLLAVLLASVASWLAAEGVVTLVRAWRVPSSARGAVRPAR